MTGEMRMMEETTMTMRRKMMRRRGRVALVSVFVLRSLSTHPAPQHVRAVADGSCPQQLADAADAAAGWRGGGAGGAPTGVAGRPAPRVRAQGVSAAAASARRPCGWQSSAGWSKVVAPQAG